ncbi:DNA-directed RNA polymerase III subunit RPC3-like isoform X1 [Homarus americanus]|uniref:DNA-directed RNA polymerase III subunit RPC3-like isoform X1 n=2 Tax=Homarus americanus TaxID=6706 RepID=UPI001C464BA6|nr:DNA-directed RNA polymerase III subunit RPC3-like isoform X1 [Homarus americanus]
MSYYLQKICYKILNEYFGDIVAKVGEALFLKGVNPLRVICASTKLPLVKVSEAVAVLIQHNLVTWEEWRPGIPCYTLLHDRVLLILRFPRYVYLVREQFGEEGEMVVDVLLKEGQATASHIIVTSCVKLLEASDNDDGGGGCNYEQQHITIRNHLLKLIENEFIQRCPSPQDPSKPVPILSIKQEDLYNLPQDLLDLKALQQEIQHRHTETTKPTFTHPDTNVFWRLNYDRFHIEFRDSEIRNSIVRRVDPLAGECLGAMLKLSYKVSDPWAAIMNVVTAADIRDQLKDLKYLDQYFKILEEQSGECVQRVGDAGGGQYRLNMANAFQSLTHTLIYNIVQERFGSKAARIFRLIHKKQMMEQDMIGEVSMIGKKEANLLSYRLLHDNFLRIHELRKTLTPSPANKIIYLFHVDINSVVRMVLEWCYKSMYNLIVQRETRGTDNRRLLEKRTRVDSIVENLKQSGGTEEQIQEVEEMMTPSERALVEQVLSTQDKLFDSETGLDETIFILQMYLYYQVQKT